MLLKEILAGLEVCSVIGDTGIEIGSIAYDSRKARADSLFVCMEGRTTDGHKFIPDALKNGTRAFIVSKDSPDLVSKDSPDLPQGITVIKVTDSRYALAFVSDAFFGHPSRKFKLVGITGTKGKTTTTYMIKSILEKANQKVGLIGTVANIIGDEKIPADRTTPESYDLQSMFSDMAGKNADTVVMEVSSQGLELHRVSFCDFDIGVFTNLSRAHIGGIEHASFEDYFKAKMMLFKMCKKGLVNVDSEYGKTVIENAACDVTTYGIEEDCDIKAVNVMKKSDCVIFDVLTPWGNSEIYVNVPGSFSVYNALAAIGTCGLMGISLDIIRQGLAAISVPGRVETVPTGEDFTIIIDYAYTPDSLKNILSTVRDFAAGRTVCLFGCGGDRDKMMRSMMGELAGQLADFTIITSDNPRSEEPEDIINQIEAGIKKTNGNYIKITERREAIKFAIMNARPKDVIILAGKGHETYQQFKDKKIHFDEREVVNDILKEKAAGG